jgi:DNA-directed RNA polymerase specialized sigma subunit
LRRKARAVEDAIEVLTGQLCRSPTEIAIAQQLHIDLGEYQHLLGELKGLTLVRYMRNGRRMEGKKSGSMCRADRKMIHCSVSCTPRRESA